MRRECRSDRALRVPLWACRFATPMLSRGTQTCEFIFIATVARKSNGTRLSFLLRSKILERTLRIGGTCSYFISDGQNAQSKHRPSTVHFFFSIYLLKLNSSNSPAEWWSCEQAGTSNFNKTGGVHAPPLPYTHTPEIADLLVHVGIWMGKLG